MARQTIGGVRRHVILPKPQDAKLVAHAKKTGMTPSEHIRRAIDTYFRAIELNEKRTQ